MKAGDLVKLRRNIGPPELYGYGLIVKIEGSRCLISWSENENGRLGSAAPYALELISASR